MRRMSRFLFSVPITDVPEEVEILHTGSFNHRVYGKFDVTKADLESMVKEFDREPEALIDVDHNASKGTTRAAGWVKALRIDGEKLFARPKWTKYGEDSITSQEYRRISAEFGPTRDHTGKTGPVALQAFTLTNRPFLRTLRPLTLMLDDGDATIILDGMPSCGDHDMHDNQCAACRALDSSTPGATLGSGDGADHPTNRNRSMTDTIRSVLKLADDVTDEAVTAALIKALAEKQEPADDVVALADYESVKKLAEDAQKEATAATTAAAKATKELADLHRDTWFTEQVRTGKITPAEQEATLALYDAAPDQTRALIEARPVNRTLTSAIGGGAAPGQVDLSTKEGRDALNDAAMKLMAENPKLDIGTAQVMAEKAMTA